MLIMPAGLLSAQDSRPLIDVQAEVDTAQITIGDRIRYTLTIDHVKGMRVEQPGPGANLGQFEIKDYQIYDPETYDDRIRLRYTYVVSVFDTGKFVIPPFPVAYFPADSAGDYRIIEASPIDITVNSVINDSKKELKDIKDPIWIPFDYTLIAVAAVIVILLAAAGFFGYRLYRQKKEQGYLFKPPEPPRPAHELALEQLEILLGKDYLANGRFKLFYSELSEILRRYIEGRFFVPALEETSREILQEIDKQELQEDLQSVLKDFLELADLVKFARYNPDQSENQQAPEWVRSFVDETKIEFEAEPAETGVSVSEEQT
jgi:hypothetical protein